MEEKVMQIFFFDNGIRIHDLSSKYNYEIYIPKEFFERLKKIFDKFEEFKKDNIESITIKI